MVFLFFFIESQVVKRVLAMMGWDKAMLKRKMPFTARQVPSSSPRSRMRTCAHGAGRQQSKKGPSASAICELKA